MQQDQKPVVAITGATLWGNRGAEAMLVTTIGELRHRFPNIHITVGSYFPERDRELIEDLSIDVISITPLALVFRHLPFAVAARLLDLIGIRLPDRLLSREAVQLRRADMLIDLNGIAYADGREKFLPFNILQNWPAHLLGTPVIRLSQALGSFHNPLNRLAAKLFLTSSKHIFARGEITAAHLQQLGIPDEQWTLASDIAFSYQPEYSLTHENEDKVEALADELRQFRTEGQTVIGLTPSSVVYAKAKKANEPYLEKFVELFADFADGAAIFVVVPNATREGTDTPRNNDLVTISILQEMSKATLPTNIYDRIRWVTYDVNTAATRRILEHVDVLVTSRFHTMISGLSLTIPTIVIGWSHKYREVLADFDLEHLAVDYRDIGMHISTSVREILANPEAIHQKLRQYLPEVKDLSIRQFDKLEQFLR